MSINRHSTHGYVQAHVPYDPIKHKTHQHFIKKTAYRPICTNDSSIFERTFYLDYGTTYIVFYDFNSVWNIDLTLSVHPSEFNALSNFEESYCNKKVQVYKFQDFVINCSFSMIKLTRQVPLLVHWSRVEVPEESIIKSVFYWPGLMDLTVNHKHRNLVVSRAQEENCTPSNALFMFGASSTTTLLLGENAHNQKVLNVDVLRVEHGIGNCPDMDQSIYNVIFTPAIVNHYCILVHNNIFQPPSKSQLIHSDCFKGEGTMTTGLYRLYGIDSHVQNNWKYYSITIGEACYRGAQIKVYFRSSTLKQRRFFYYELTPNKHHHILHDYGFRRFFYFYLDRYVSQCTAYIELTPTLHNRNHQFHNRFSFKVSNYKNVNSYISD